MKNNILVTGAIHPDSLAELKKNSNYEVDYSPDLSRNDLLMKVRNCHLLLTRSETTIDVEVIDSAPNLKIIARAAVGVGNIDLGYATKKGILVFNTPGKNTNSAAEMTLGLILSMLRKIPQAYSSMKKGSWNRHQFTGQELRYKTIGIVGIGHVGHRVARFCHGFEMKVLGFDPYVSPELFSRYQIGHKKTLNDLLCACDILSVHVPLNKETRGMIGELQLSMLKKGSYVVNAARGGVIDETALASSIRSKHLAGAAIDTWLDEPAPSPDLVNLPHVWVSPHIGASTIEAQKAIGDTVVEQIDKAIKGGVVDFPVNLPEVGIIDNPLVKPYALLAEKIGWLAAQIMSFNPSECEIMYRGDLTEVDQGLIKLGLMKGYTSFAVDSFVSYVNAETSFSELGIRLIENQDRVFTSYKSAIKINFRDSFGSSLSIGGLVFDNKYIRISLVDDFYFEVEPKGDFLMIRNIDKPGVVGAIGMTLSNNLVNIDSFDLSRNKRGEKAMALIKVDQKLPAEITEEIQSIENVTEAYSISL